MFSFFGSIIGKIASAVVSVFVAIGIVSSPASVAPQPSEEPIMVETASSTPTVETQEKIDIKAELNALKKQIADEQKKRKDLENKIVVPAPAPKPAPIVVTPPPAPIVVTPVPTPTPTTPGVQLLPGQFLLPSGAIANAQGIIIQAAPAPVVPNQPIATTTPVVVTPPPPAPMVWPPTEGTTVDIKQSMLSAMSFNNHLTCDQLALVQSIPPSKKDLCILYKEKRDKYTWNTIQDI